MNGTVKLAGGLVLAAGLLSGAFVLLAGCQKEKPATPAKTTQTEAPNATAAPATETAQVAEQTTCPVLAQPINKSIFVEYKGKKVYFCCEDCKATFAKDPEKYVKGLPQFKE